MKRGNKIVKRLYIMSFQERTRTVFFSSTHGCDNITYIATALRCKHAGCTIVHILDLTILDYMPLCLSVFDKHEKAYFLIKKNTWEVQGDFESKKCFTVSAISILSIYPARWNQTAISDNIIRSCLESPITPKMLTQILEAIPPLP